MNDANLPVLQLDLDRRLVELFGECVPPEELKTWAGMPEARRATAIQRMKALDRYCSDGSKLTAAQAAADAGVKLGRFYQMARQWKERRSLGSLGAFASATKSRQKMKPEIANALQSAVVRVVDNSTEGDSLTSLAKKLAVESGLPRPPALNTLRAFIEREQRRVRKARLAGNELMFDLAASSLQRNDGSPHVVFLIIDKGTGLILGHAEGSADRSALGYGQAALDALRRLPSLGSNRRLWSESIANSEIVPGIDEEEVFAIAAKLKTELGGFAPQLTGQKKAGSYMRRHLGLHIGTVWLVPPHTFASARPSLQKGSSMPLTSEDAHARVELAVTEHNAALLVNLSLEGAEAPPTDLVQLLEAMAAS